MKWSFPQRMWEPRATQCSSTMIELMVEKSHDGVGDEYSTELQALAGFPRWLCIDVCLTNDLSHIFKNQNEWALNTHHQD